MPAGFFNPCNMSNRFARYALFFSGLVLLASCGTLPELQKPKYRDGFYFNKSGTVKRVESQAMVEKQIASTNTPGILVFSVKEAALTSPVLPDTILVEAPATKPALATMPEQHHAVNTTPAHSSDAKAAPRSRPMDYVVEPGPLLVAGILLFLVALALVWMCFLGPVFLIAAIVFGLVAAFLALGLTLVNTNNCYSRGWIITTEIFLVAVMLLLLPCTLLCLFFIFVIWNRLS